MCNQSGNTAYEGYGVLPKVIWGNRQFNSIRNATSRLMYIYMRTGPEFSPSGLFHIDPSSLAYASRSPVKDVAVYMEPLQRANLLKWDGQVVWLTGVREHFVQTTTPDQLIRIDADVAKVLPCDLLREYSEEYGINPAAIIEHDAMEAAVSTVIKRSLMLFDWNEKETCRNLTRAGHTAEEVMLVFGQPGGLWYKHDWRGQKGQLPKFSDVRTSLEPLLLTVGKEQVIKYKVDEEKLGKMLKGLAKAGKGWTFAKEKVVEEFGEPIWEKLIARSAWSDWLVIESSQIKWRIKEALARPKLGCLPTAKRQRKLFWGASRLTLMPFTSWST